MNGRGGVDGVCGETVGLRVRQQRMYAGPPWPKKGATQCRAQYTERKSPSHRSSAHDDQIHCAERREDELCHRAEGKGDCCDNFAIPLLCPEKNKTAEDDESIIVALGGHSPSEKRIESKRREPSRRTR